MTTKFDLHLIVPAKLIGAIVELVQGEGILVSLKHHEPPATDKRKSVAHNYVDGKRYKDVSGDELMRQFIVGKTKFTHHDVRREFAKHGFAAGSASSRISYAKSAGLVRSTGFGQYEVVK